MNRIGSIRNPVGSDIDKKNFDPNIIRSDPDQIKK
jgi:hypothetical protein